MRDLGNLSKIWLASLSALMVATAGKPALAAPGTVTVYSTICYVPDEGDVGGESIGIVDLGEDDVYFLYAKAVSHSGDWVIISPKPDAVKKFRAGRLEFVLRDDEGTPLSIRAAVTKNALVVTEHREGNWNSASPKKPLRVPKVKLPQRWPACR